VEARGGGGDGVLMRPITGIALGLFVATSALGQAGSGLLTTAEIRARAESAKTQGVALPMIVTESFLLAEDKKFRARYPLDSTVTRNVAQQMVGVDMTRGALQLMVQTISGALTADEVAALYVTGVFMGLGCFGAQEAASAYFGQPLEALTSAQIAYLAVLPKGPSMLHPEREADRAVTLRNSVLDKMAGAGLISVQEASQSAQEPLGTQDPLGQCAGN